MTGPQKKKDVKKEAQPHCKTENGLTTYEVRVSLSWAERYLAIRKHGSVEHQLKSQMKKKIV